MTNPSWFYPQGALAHEGWESVVDGSISGWQYTGVRVGVLAAGESLSLPGADEERLIVPLEGSFEVSYLVDGDSATQELRGRLDVFHGSTDVLYIPTGASLTVQGVGRVAVASSPTTERKPVQYIEASAVEPELRGAGRSSRQVHNFGTPANLDAARMIVCEVITPSENWSSYPPHKHDEYVPGAESRLEEIYYFETAVSRGTVAPTAAEPFGFLQTSSSPAGTIDTLAEVHTGDIALVPFGWHGPCVAAPGYDLYYLNVMAGPDPERTWLITDEPAHAWVRQTWDNQTVDSRLPYTAE